MDIKKQGELLEKVYGQLPKLTENGTGIPIEYFSWWQLTGAKKIGLLEIIETGYSLLNLKLYLKTVRVALSKGKDYFLDTDNHPKIIHTPSASAMQITLEAII